MPRVRQLHRSNICLKRLHDARKRVAALGYIPGLLLSSSPFSSQAEYQWCWVYLKVVQKLHRILWDEESGFLSGYWISRTTILITSGTGGSDKSYKILENRNSFSELHIFLNIQNVFAITKVGCRIVFTIYFLRIIYSLHRVSSFR